MNTRKFVLRQTGILAAGELVCAGVMVAVFALLGHFNSTVALGAVAGCILSVGNFFFMAVAAEAAADKAVNDDVKGGQATIKASFRTRIVVLFALLFLLAKSGACNPIAMIIPLVLVRPVLTVAEFFRKAGEKQE